MASKQYYIDQRQQKRKLNLGQLPPDGQAHKVQHGEDSFSDDVDDEKLEKFFFKEREDVTYAEEGT